METFCHKCGTKNINRKYCSNCGVQLVTQESSPPIQHTHSPKKVQIECPWCKTVNKVAEEKNCRNCGGPLPAIRHNNEGIDKGESPGAPPRELPKVYIKKLKYRNTHFLIGLIFTAV